MSKTNKKSKGRSVKQVAIESAVATLRKIDGTKAVRVYLRDGDMRDVALGTARYKWNQLANALEAYAWLRLEAINRDGAVLGVFDHPDGGAAGVLEDLPTGMDRSNLTEVQGMMAIMLHGQRSVLDQQLALVNAAVSAQTAALEAATKRLEALERSMSSLLTLVKKTVRDSAEMSNEAAEALAEAMSMVAERDGEDEAQMRQVKGYVYAELAKKFLGGGGETPPNGT